MKTYKIVKSQNFFTIFFVWSILFRSDHTAHLLNPAWLHTRSPLPTLDIVPSVAAFYPHMSFNTY